MATGDDGGLNFIYVHLNRLNLPLRAYAKQAIQNKLMDHEEYIRRYGDDMPEIAGWSWGQMAAAAGAVRSTEADNI